MPCTTLLVGRRASADGSPLVARTEDSSAGTFDPKRVVVVRPEDQPRTYTSVIGGRTIELPEEPLRYTSIPNALPDEGVWGCAGINAANVAMSATETITSNPRVLGADPLVERDGEIPGGFGEEDFLTLVLPYIRSAREGVQRLGARWPSTAPMNERDRVQRCRGHLVAGDRGRAPLIAGACPRTTT